MNMRIKEKNLKNLYPLNPKEMESKPLGGTWAPKLHPGPSTAGRPPRKLENICSWKPLVKGWVEWQLLLWILKAWHSSNTYVPFLLNENMCTDMRERWTDGWMDGGEKGGVGEAGERGRDRDKKPCVCECMCECVYTKYYRETTQSECIVGWENFSVQPWRTNTSKFTYLYTYLCIGKMYSRERLCVLCVCVCGVVVVVVYAYLL